MDKSEKIFLFLFATVLTALVIWEVRSRQSATPLTVTDSGDSSTAQTAVPLAATGREYLVYNQPQYNPGPPMFNVMPAMAKAVALNNSGSCYSCGG